MGLLTHHAGLVQCYQAQRAETEETAEQGAEEVHSGHVIGHWPLVWLGLRCEFRREEKERGRGE